MTIWRIKKAFIVWKNTTDNYTIEGLPLLTFKCNSNSKLIWGMNESQCVSKINHYLSQCKNDKFLQTSVNSTYTTKSYTISVGNEKNLHNVETSLSCLTLWEHAKRKYNSVVVIKVHFIIDRYLLSFTLFIPFLIGYLSFANNLTIKTVNELDNKIYMVFQSPINSLI